MKHKIRNCHSKIPALSNNLRMIWKQSLKELNKLFCFNMRSMFNWTIKDFVTWRVQVLIYVSINPGEQSTYSCKNVLHFSVSRKCVRRFLPRTFTIDLIHNVIETSKFDWLKCFFDGGILESQNTEAKRRTSERFS